MPQVPAVVSFLESRVTEFEAARPTGFSEEGSRIVRSVKNAMMENPDLLKCSQQSVYTAVMHAVNDGVILDGRQAALIPYGKRAQYVLMYRGMILIVYRTGLVTNIDVHTVWEAEVDQDRFDWISGDRPQVIHRPVIFGNKGEPVAFYSIVNLRGGGISREIMSADEVNRIRDRSTRKNPVWQSDYVEMGKKTVLRRHLKRLPFGITMQTHDADEFDQRPDIEPEDESQEVQAERQPRREKGAASSRLKQAKSEPETIDMDPETGEIADRDEELTGDAADMF